MSTSRVEEVRSLLAAGLMAKDIESIGVVLLDVGCRRLSGSLLVLRLCDVEEPSSCCCCMLLLLLLLRCAGGCSVAVALLGFAPEASCTEAQEGAANFFPSSIGFMVCECNGGSFATAFYSIKPQNRQLFQLVSILHATFRAKE